MVDQSAVPEVAEGGMLPVSATDAAIEIVDMNKWYGDFHVLKNINLKVMRGERIVICGPSGSGKSTMIRCINRLEEHQTGTIVVDGIELTNDLKRIDEIRREVGMVFQHFNLFPHLTILENLHARADLGAADAEARRRGDRDALPDPGEDPGAGEEVSRPALRRPAAARGDRPRALHEPADHAVRRADLGARPGDDQGGARRHGRPRRGGDDHARASPTRWASRGRSPTASSSWTPARSSSRTSRRRSSTIRSTSGPSCSSARSCIEGRETMRRRAAAFVLAIGSSPGRAGDRRRRRRKAARERTWTTPTSRSCRRPTAPSARATSPA